jgi:hypothetical protein
MSSNIVHSNGVANIFIILFIPLMNPLHAHNLSLMANQLINKAYVIKQIPNDSRCLTAKCLGD